MTTFSQIVDKIALETRRPDLVTDIATYCNQAMRELHMEPSQGNAVFFPENRKEVQIVSTVDDGLSWDVPNPAIFQGMEAVRFDSAITIQTDPIWARSANPGRAMNQMDYFYYRAGPRFFFRGNGGVGSIVSLSYYEFVRSLKYYASGSRPAIWDDDSGWTYAPDYDVSDDTRQLAQDMTTNWLLTRWDSLIEEGLRAKVYKRLADTERARTCYSMYSTLRQGMYSSETGIVSGSV